MTTARVVFAIAVAILEATPVAMALAMLGAGGVWPALVLVAAGAAALDRATRQLQPAWLDRGVLGIGAAVLASWGTKVLVGGGYHPLAGWEQLWATLSGAAGRPIIGYLGLIPTLYIAWRGTRIAGQDLHAIRTIFGVGTLLALLVIMLGALGGAAALRGTEPAGLLLGLISAGLVARSLANAAEHGDAQWRLLGWRGAITLAASVVLVLVAGLAVGLVGADAAMSLARAIVGTLAAVVLAVFAPLLWLLDRAVTLLRPWLSRGQIGASPEQELEEWQPGDTSNPFGAGSAPAPWLETVLSAVSVSLPLLILLLAIVLIARQRRAGRSRQEERESLLSWQALVADTSDLIATMRQLIMRRGTALERALQGLRGQEPGIRVRRAYVRLLIALERQGLSRAAAQTPAEFAAQAARQADHPEHIAPLTALYERARYRPGGVTDQEAAESERLT